MDISVAIGRNVGEEPMSDESWGAYRVVVFQAIRRVGFAITCEESGKSTYRDESGIAATEEHYRVFATMDMGKFEVAAYLALRDKLDLIRKAWQQWGIALSIVKTDMVGA